MTKFIFIEVSRKKSIRPRKIVFEANYNNLSESLLKQGYRLMVDYEDHRAFEDAEIVFGEGLVTVSLKTADYILLKAGG